MDPIANKIMLAMPESGNRYVKMLRTCQKIGSGTWVEWQIPTQFMKKALIRYLTYSFERRDELELCVEQSKRYTLLMRLKPSQEAAPGPSEEQPAPNL